MTRQCETMQLESVDIQIVVHHIPNIHFPRGGCCIVRIVLKEDGVLQAAAVLDEMQFGGASRGQLVVGIIARRGLRIRAGGVRAAFGLGAVGFSLVLQIVVTDVCLPYEFLLAALSRSLLVTVEAVAHIAVIQFRGKA